MTPSNEIFPRHAARVLAFSWVNFMARQVQCCARNGFLAVKSRNECWVFVLRWWKSGTSVCQWRTKSLSPLPCQLIQKLIQEKTWNTKNSDKIALWQLYRSNIRAYTYMACSTVQVYTTPYKWNQRHDIHEGVEFRNPYFSNWQKRHGNGDCLFYSFQWKEEKQTRPLKMGHCISFRRQLQRNSSVALSGDST